MIIVKGRELLIPENERYIGTNYDAGMENRLFRIPRYSQSGTDLSDLVFKINLVFDGDPLDRAEMVKAVEDDYIYLTWAVTAAQVVVTGTVFACITGNDTNDTVKWSSFQAPFYTEKSLGDDIDTAYHDLVNKVAQEIADRENAVSAERTARESADAAETSAREAAVTAEATARQTADTTLQQNIDAEAAARAAGDAAANTRIDNIVAQSGDDITEIVDARTGTDSVVHASLKARLDSENSQLKSALIIDNNYNYLVKHPFNSTTSNGVTFTRQEDGSVKVAGTTTDSSAYGYYFNASNKTPTFIQAGKSYHVDFSGTSVSLRLSYYDTSWHVFFTSKKSSNFTVPNSLVGLRIQLFVNGNGITVDETVCAKIVEIKSEDEKRFERINIGAASESAFSSIEKTTLRKTDMMWFFGKNVNGAGTIQNNTSAALSSVIAVSEGTQIERIGESSDSNNKVLFMYVNAYENMVFKSRTKLNRFDMYTVPSDVNAVCFGFARASEQGVDMTAADIESYFDIKWHFATESSTDAEQIPNSGEYIDNLLEKFCVFGSGSYNGIDYDLIDNESHAYYVHGSTSDSISFYNLYNGLLPGCLERGKTYFIYYENSAEARNCHARFVFYDKDGNVTQPTSSGYPYTVTIPNDAFIMVFRLYVARNQTVDTTIKFLKLVEVQEQKMLVPYIISFVDDDASSTTYVERYYNSCKRNGINGNYAVITNYWDRGATDPDLLIDYEDDGMAMLIHCSEQSYSLAPEWMDRDYDGCRKNLYKGMRAMQEKGFVNFRYWIMPYGYVNDDFKRLATDAGMKCMISSANFNYNKMGDADRYYIKRYSLDPIDREDGRGTLATIKTAIDEMQNLPSCWLIITTHFNEWGSVTWDSTVDSTGYPVGYARMNEIIQYAKASGAQVLTVPEAWRFYEPIIEANEQRYNKIRP